MSINMNSKKIKAQFVKETNPRVGLIVLSTDNMIEKDFSKVLSDKPVDLYVNRIKNYNPVTAENLKKCQKILLQLRITYYQEKKWIVLFLDAHQEQ